MITTLIGTIEQRLLINYRVDPDVMAARLPPPFTPSLVAGHAIAGICLIQLRIRPRWAPTVAAVGSLNGAHRVAVTLPDGSDAVYVPRRHTDSRLGTLMGGRLFPGQLGHAAMTTRRLGDRFAVTLTSSAGSTHVAVAASLADELPTGSVFDDVDHASGFFERGALGYSDTPRGDHYEGIELRTENWSVVPLAVEHAVSSYFDDPAMFPVGSVALDNALLMRNIRHSWHRAAPLSSIDLVPTGRGDLGSVDGRPTSLG